MSVDLEDSLVEYYSTHSDEAELTPSNDLTERLLYIRDLLLANPPPTEPGAHLYGLEVTNTLTGCSNILTIITCNIN